LFIPKIKMKYVSGTLLLIFSSYVCGKIKKDHEMVLDGAQRDLKSSKTKKSSKSSYSESHWSKSKARSNKSRTSESRSNSHSSDSSESKSRSKKSGSSDSHRSRSTTSNSGRSNDNTSKSSKSESGTSRSSNSRSRSFSSDSFDDESASRKTELFFWEQEGNIIYLNGTNFCLRARTEKQLVLSDRCDDIIEQKSIWSLAEFDGNSDSASSTAVPPATHTFENGHYGACLSSNYDENNENYDTKLRLKNCDNTNSIMEWVLEDGKIWFHEDMILMTNKAENKASVYLGEAPETEIARSIPYTPFFTNDSKDIPNDDTTPGPIVPTVGRTDSRPESVRQSSKPTSSPTSLQHYYKNKIEKLLVDISGESLQLEGSPQLKALQWILNDDFSINHSEKDEVLIQRYALATIYYSTFGDGWVVNDSWLSDVSECEWHGITCNDDYVIELKLDENQLEGSLPDEIGVLLSLESLNADDNSITGSIPSTIGNLINMIEIDIDTNYLGGTIPDEIYNLSELQILDIDTNTFTGTISSDIRKLEKLFYVQLSYNYFSGTIPEEFSNLSHLIVLTIEENDFVGDIPTSLCQLQPNLRDLWADCNGPKIKNKCSCCTECFPRIY